MVRNSPRDVCTGPSSPPNPPANVDSPGRSDAHTFSERIPTTIKLGVSGIILDRICFQMTLKPTFQFMVKRNKQILRLSQKKLNKHTDHFSVSVFLGLVTS